MSAATATWTRASSGPISASAEALKIMGELDYESRRYPRRVTCDSEVPSDLLVVLKSSAEAGEAAFVSYCKRVVWSYERAYAAFLSSVGDVPVAAMVEPFRELVVLYRAVVDVHGIRDYAVGCGLLAGNKLYRRELFVRGTPAGVMYDVERLVNSLA